MALLTRRRDGSAAWFSSFAEVKSRSSMTRNPPGLASAKLLPDVLASPVVDQYVATPRKIEPTVQRNVEEVAFDNLIRHGGQVPDLVRIGIDSDYLATARNASYTFHDRTCTARLPNTASPPEFP